jgi:hypothetical protein
MNRTLVSVLAAGLLSAAPAFASPVTLTFEGVGLVTDASIGNVYGGLTFGPDAIALVAEGDFPFHSNAPTPPTVMAPVGLGDAALNASIGFIGTASFYYSSSVDTSVQIWSGLNGTGSVLATFLLAANAQNGCNDTPNCHWDLVSQAFAGVAQSIGFGSALGAGFDNITINTVPLPAAAWLLMSALGGLGTVVRRKRSA